jgi:hypothetical protein
MAMIRAPKEDIPVDPSVANSRNPQIGIYYIFTMISLNRRRSTLLTYEAH